MIYCPRCGKPATFQQRFCTGCGLSLRAVISALAGESMTEEERKNLAQRLKTLRYGLQQMFSGIGLALFFYLFFHSVGFAAIGAMVFFIGLGQVLSAMLVASPPLRLRWHVPSPSEMQTSLPPHEPTPTLTRDLAEPPTIPLDNTRSAPPPSRSYRPDTRGRGDTRS
jgi:hypothetical protein